MTTSDLGNNRINKSRRLNHLIIGPFDFTVNLHKLRFRNDSYSKVIVIVIHLVAPVHRLLVVAGIRGELKLSPARDRDSILFTANEQWLDCNKLKFSVRDVDYFCKQRNSTDLAEFIFSYSRLTKTLQHSTQREPER